MDPQTLVQALANTLDPNLRKQAETFLDEVGRDVFSSRHGALRELGRGRACSELGRSFVCASESRVVCETSAP